MRILAVIPQTVTPGSCRIRLRLLINYIPMQATIKKILNAVVVGVTNSALNGVAQPTPPPGSPVRMSLADDGVTHHVRVVLGDPQ
jgi:hypothetical protein